ncbi:MAG TPA: efflux RND transporter periplasmic adaptor subunit [Spirochaetales bacterium]|nr:efflux RND transporter periplasmic adaptor subunit [Spirochaetales bacterium]
MKKSVLIGFILVSAFSLYLGMEIERRKTPGTGSEGSGGTPSGSAPAKPVGGPINAGPNSSVSGGTNGNGSPTGNRRGAVSVETVSVEIGEIRRLGNFTGTLEARSQFVLSSKIAGRIEQILVDVGDEVRKGQLVALLEDDEYQRQVDQAEADLEAARANLEDAEGALETASREFERAKSLYAGKIIAASELDVAASQYRKAEAALKVVQAQLKQREAALAIIQDRLQATRIVAEWNSPEPSRVNGERYVDPGTLLRANDPICSILDISSLIGVVNVTEQDYPRLQPGQIVSVMAEILPDRKFSGQVERIAPFLDPATRQAEVQIAVPNPQKELKPGMFIRAVVEYGRRDKVRIVPEISIVKRDEKTGVFLVNPEEGRVRFVPVVTGIGQEGRVEIVSPALSGSIVITGQHLLQDGSFVTVVSGTSSNLEKGAGER